MDTLSLAPLPSETTEQSRSLRRSRVEGFIDENVVSRVIERGAYDRHPVQPEGMALSSSEDDYAGWALPVTSPFREMTESPSTSPAVVRLPGMPRLRKDAEPGVGAPYEGGHRWWLFGMSGALACGIMALTFLGIAQSKGRPGTTGMNSAPASPTSRAVVPVTAIEGPVISPALTTILPADR
ncbi:hypothetical protein HZ994_10595 [Akkermansiaceae bacterium]|nr:hypothetical protein HZ994_10595 [Akkermansiaceae bacterium]